MYVFDSVQCKLQERKQSNGISPILKLACALRFFGEGSYQRGVGNDINLGLSQPAVSNVLSEVVRVIEKCICPKWIKSKMTPEEERQAKLSFFEKTGFPGVIGSVDGTHIAIVPPRQEEQHLYRNRKGFFSMNVMIVCDNNICIRFVDARYSGENHDALIWNLSDIRKRLQENFESGQGLNTCYLGDAGYPLEPFLITPFRAAQAGSIEAAFNTKHAQTRNIVERTIRVLKSRLRCLHVDRTLHYSPDKATQIINASSALHNICRYYKVPDFEINFQEESIEIPLQENENRITRDIRNSILQSFNNS